MLGNEQRELVQQLNQIVRSTDEFRAAEAEGKLVRLPVGDGMALVFFNSPEAPAAMFNRKKFRIGQNPWFSLKEASAAADT